MALTKSQKAFAAALAKAGVANSKSIVEKDAARFATLENAALSMDWNTVIDICGGSHNIVANWIWGHAVEAKCGAPHNRQVFIMELLEKIRIA